MIAQSENRHEIVETLDRVFVTGKGWFDDVEVRICWTETRVSPEFPPKSDKHYVRAYSKEGTIIQHVFDPFKSKGAAKRHVPSFVAALKTNTSRAEERQPRRVPSAEQPAARHWAT